MGDIKSSNRIAWARSEGIYEKVVTLGGMTRKQAHIAKMTADQCEALITLLARESGAGC